MERWTIDWFNTATNKELIAACIRERRGHCTNVNTPLYERLTRLLEWVEERAEDEIKTDPNTLLLATAPELLGALKALRNSEANMREYAAKGIEAPSLAIVRCYEIAAHAEKVIAKAEGRE